MHGRVPAPAPKLDLAIERLETQESALLDFAEKERAVQIDAQAEATIESSAELEAERLKLELQERAIGSVLTGLKNKGARGNANLPGNFFDDPILWRDPGLLFGLEFELSPNEEVLADRMADWLDRDVLRRTEWSA